MSAVNQVNIKSSETFYEKNILIHLGLGMFWECCLWIQLNEFYCLFFYFSMVIWEMIVEIPVRGSKYEGPTYTSMLWDCIWKDTMSAKYRRHSLEWGYKTKVRILDTGHNIVLQIEVIHFGLQIQVFSESSGDELYPQSRLKASIHNHSNLWLFFVETNLLFVSQSKFFKFFLSKNIILNCNISNKHYFIGRNFRGEKFWRYFADSLKNRKNKSREKYFLHPKAKINLLEIFKIFHFTILLLVFPKYALL